MYSTYVSFHEDKFELPMEINGEMQQSQLADISWMAFLPCWGLHGVLAD